MLKYAVCIYIQKDSMVLCFVHKSIELEARGDHYIIWYDLLYLRGHYISPTYLCIEPNLIVKLNRLSSRLLL